VTADLVAAVEARPNHKTVLLGYSRAGKFVSSLMDKEGWGVGYIMELMKIVAYCGGDTLGGDAGGNLGDAETPPVDYADYGSNVKAAIMASPSTPQPKLSEY
jgi:hypothetical protein